MIIIGAYKYFFKYGYLTIFKGTLPLPSAAGLLYLNLFTVYSSGLGIYMLIVCVANKKK